MPNVDLTQLQNPQDITAARLEEWRAGAIRSKAEFAIALAEASIITSTEAEGWIDGILPAAVSAAIATLPTGGQPSARITMKGATTVHRTDPILILLDSAYGLSDAPIDTLFGNPPATNQLNDCLHPRREFTSLSDSDCQFMNGPIAPTS